MQNIAIRALKQKSPYIAVLLESSFSRILDQFIGCCIGKQQFGFVTFGFLELHRSIGNDDDHITNGDFSDCWPIHAYLSRTPLSFNHISLQTLSVIEIEDLYLFILNNI